MYVTPEQIQAAGKAHVEAILSLASSQFAAFEKFASLNANAVKTVFEDSIANARALAGGASGQRLLNPRAGLSGISTDEDPRPVSIRWQRTDERGAETANRRVVEGSVAGPATDTVGAEDFLGGVTHERWWKRLSGQSELAGRRRASVWETSTTAMPGGE